MFLAADMCLFDCLFVVILATDLRVFGSFFDTGTVRNEALALQCFEKAAAAGIDRVLLRFACSGVRFFCDV